MLFKSKKERRCLQFPVIVSIMVILVLAAIVMAFSTGNNRIDRVGESPVGSFYSSEVRSGDQMIEVSITP